MRVTVEVISVLLIILGQFARFRYKENKGIKSVNDFLESEYLWSALYEIGIIFLGAILAIQLTEYSEVRIQKEKTINVLEQVSMLLSNDELSLDLPIKMDELSDDEYTERIRKDISTAVFNSDEIAKEVISQTDIQGQITATTYIRLMEILARRDYYANELLTTAYPSFIHSQIKDEQDSFDFCTKREIDYLNGKINNIGDWIGKKIEIEPK